MDTAIPSEITENKNERGIFVRNFSHQNFNGVSVIFPSDLRRSAKLQIADNNETHAVMSFGLSGIIGGLSVEIGRGEKENKKEDVPTFHYTSSILLISGASNM